tara:strand:+ start:5822 stop:5965 length:144 start_codon:yes stop_codon:yes gene_type:complete
MRTTARQMVEKLTKEELITEIYHLLIILPIKEQKYQREFINNKKQKQ